MFAVDPEWPVSQETEFESAHRRHRQPRKISFDLEDEADEVSEEGIFPSSEEAARERDPPPRELSKEEHEMMWETVWHPSC